MKRGGMKVYVEGRTRKAFFVDGIFYGEDGKRGEGSHISGRQGNFLINGLKKMRLQLW